MSASFIRHESVPASGPTPRSSILARGTAALGLAALVGILVITTLSDYGVTWDEVLYLDEGTAYTEWLQSPSFDTIDEVWRSTHPPLHRILGGQTRALFFERLGWFAELDAFRLATVFFVVALTGALFLFADELLGSAVAAIVVLMFFTMPRVFFHAHIGALDISIASVGLCACYAYYRSFERPVWIAAAAGLLGAGVAMKLNAALIVLPMIALLAVRLIESVRSGRPIAPMLMRQLPMAIVPPVLFVAVWPWLWSDPIGRALALFQYHGEHFAIPTYFMGQVHAESPFSYPFVMTALTVPVPTLLLAVTGLVGFRRFEQRSALTFLLAGAIAPLLVLALPGIPKSGGVRHLLVSYPFLCLLAGFGVRETLGWFRNPGARRAALAACVVVVVGSGVPAVARLHPFQFAYFNSLIGGPTGAVSRGFDLDYWGGSYSGLLDWMNAHPDRSYWMPLAPRLGEFYQRTGQLRPEIRWGSARSADSLVWLNRPSFFDREMWQCGTRMNPLARSGPAGVDLARVCDRSARAGETPSSGREDETYGSDRRATPATTAPAARTSGSSPSKSSATPQTPRASGT